MGINQDAYDFWQELGGNEKDYNISAQRKQDFLRCVLL